MEIRMFNKAEIQDIKKDLIDTPSNLKLIQNITPKENIVIYHIKTLQQKWHVTVTLEDLLQPVPPEPTVLDNIIEYNSGTVEVSQLSKINTITQEPLTNKPGTKPLLSLQSNKICYKCKQNGHFKKDCKKRKKIKEKDSNTKIIIKEDKSIAK